MIKSFFSLFIPRNIRCGYLLKSPWRGNSNKYPQRMFLGVLNTIFLNISNYLPHLELRNPSIQIVVIKNFIIISDVGIKSFDCIFNREKTYLFCSLVFCTPTSFWKWFDFRHEKFTQCTVFPSDKASVDKRCENLDWQRWGRIVDKPHILAGNKACSLRVVSHLFWV